MGNVPMIRDWSDIRKVLGKVVGNQTAEQLAIRQGKSITRSRLARDLGVEAYYSQYYGNRHSGLIALRRTDDGYELLPYPSSWSDARGNHGLGRDDVIPEAVAQNADVAVQFHICDWEGTSYAFVKEVTDRSE